LLDQNSFALVLLLLALFIILLLYVMLITFLLLLFKMSLHCGTILYYKSPRNTEHSHRPIHLIVCSVKTLSERDVLENLNMI